jgi:hypothetical protein
MMIVHELAIGNPNLASIPLPGLDRFNYISELFSAKAVEISFRCREKVDSRYMEWAI